MATVNVNLGDRSYDIVIGAAVLGEVGRHIAAIHAPGAALIVTDETVSQHYLDPVFRSLQGAGFRASAVTVPDGEASKSHEQLLKIYDACFAARLERGSLIIALGGGVVGDLAGFAAATYLRGLPCVQIPTTLLSQVDSSVGGKTAVNLPGGKNLVGAFHQPSLVLADVVSLGTLDDRQFATGMAEVVKHAMIRDASLFSRLAAERDALVARDATLLEEIVAWNCRIKAAVVADDEREGGVRAILNYGHTVGHAVEKVAAYGTYTHGEAVALGMNAEAAIALKRGRIDAATHARQQELLAAFALPSRLEGPLDVAAMVEATHHDKKVRGGKVRFVLPTAVGAVEIVDDVSESELTAALELLEP